jgi:Xaa-Pro aminopeptidase
MRLFIYLFIVVLYSSGNISAQKYKYYRYDTDLLPKEFHKGRREALRKMLPDKSVAVFFSAPVRNRSGDDDYTFHQEPDFYYLTGFVEENSMLIIFKEEQNIGGIKTNEILFIEDKDPGKEVWTGRRLGKDGVTPVLGIKTGMLNTDFDDLKLDFKKFDKILHLKFPQGAVHEHGSKADLYSLVDQFKKKYDGDKEDPFELFEDMAKLRMIKQKEELTLMRKAIDMTCDAEKEVMKSIVPGMYEYQVQSILEFEFKWNGSEYVGFPSICGGGENSCILHYESNRKKLNDKDMMVVDIGAEYHGYSADVTRSMPVNGKFSEEQKAIYNLVFKAQAEGIKLCKPGASFFEPNKAAKKIIAEGLKELGIIKSEDDVSKYFMHGTSHHLGLDVHDVQTSYELVSGNVITVEPGIYIPEGSDCDPKWWNIGVRIEDDVLITDNGCEVLSAKAPRTIEVIEALMKENSIFKIQH